MSKRLVTFLLITVMLLFSSVLAYGEGWSSMIYGSRSNSMANAYTGMADTTGESMALNAAGIGFIPEMLTVTAGIVVPNLIYYRDALDGSQANKSSKWLPFPNCYLTSSPLQKYGINLTLGFGVCIPIGGAAMDFSNIDISGPDLADAYFYIYSISFLSSIAYKLIDNEKFELSVGIVMPINYGYIEANLENLYQGEFDNPILPGGDPVPVYITMDLSGKGTCLGVNAGILVRILKFISVGFSYAHSIDMKLDGSAKTISVTGELSEGSYLTIPALSDVDLQVSYHYSENFQCGIAFDILEYAVIDFDIGYSLWEKFSYVDMKFEVPEDSLLSGQLDNIKLYTGFRNSITVRIGSELKFIPNIPIRLGYGYTQSAKRKGTSSFTGIDPDSHSVTYGASYELELENHDSLTFDISFFHQLGVAVTETNADIEQANIWSLEEFGEEAFIGPEGVYNKQVYFGFSLGIRYKFF